VHHNRLVVISVLLSLTAFVQPDLAILERYEAAIQSKQTRRFKIFGINFELLRFNKAYWRVIWLFGIKKSSRSNFLFSADKNTKIAQIHEATRQDSRKSPDQHTHFSRTSCKSC
jgi:hypothetical protein